MTFTKPNIFRFCLLLILSISFSKGNAQAQKRDIFELKIYHLDNNQQENRIDSFLKTAYIPALRKAGVKKIGVFKPIEGDTLFGKRIYVLTAYQSLKQFEKTPIFLEKDRRYLAAGQDYLNTAHDNPVYDRIEVITMQAFEGMPKFRETDLTNSPEDRIYELRSYESATENLFHNKLDMFNNGEIDIFKNLNFNPVFFGEVMAGSNMPNLMYMTAFKDKTSREAHWEAFNLHPDWEKMKSMEEYQNNVSHINIFFLQPTSYSEI